MKLPLNFISITYCLILFILLMFGWFLKARSVHSYSLLGQKINKLEQKMEKHKNEKIYYLMKVNELENFSRLEKLAKKYKLVYHEQIHPIYPLEE